MTGPDAERERCRLHARAGAFAEAAALVNTYMADGGSLDMLRRQLIRRAADCYAEFDLLAQPAGEPVGLYSVRVPS